MPLQNRVMPDGEIVALPQKGMFMGNRGIIHDPASKTLLPRRWTSKAWIICLCQYKGAHREVMARHSWTELFFLDEATGLAAGHRPCFYCRRDSAIRFSQAWAQGNGAGNIRAPIIDAVLHAERLDGKAKRVQPVEQPFSHFPTGTMFAAKQAFYATVDGRTMRWTPDGYRRNVLPAGRVDLLTPPSTIRALATGYRPALHPSAFEDT